MESSGLSWKTVLKRSCHHHNKLWHQSTLADLAPCFFAAVSSSADGPRNGSGAGQRSTNRALTSLLKLSRAASALESPGQCQGPLKVRKMFKICSLSF